MRIEPPIRENSNPGTAGETDGQSHESAGEAFRAIGQELRRLAAYVSYYFSVKADTFRLSIRRVFIYAALGLIGLVIAVAVVVTAVVLLLNGLAQAISTLLGHGPWPGNFIVGAVVLLGMIGGLWWLVGRIFKSARERTVAKYDSRKRQQRVDVGADVGQQSDFR